MTADGDGVARQVWDLELASWEALRGNAPAAFYGEVLADDATMIVPGAVLDRDAILSSWDGVAPWADYALSAQATQPLGPDVVALVYRASAHRPTEPRPYRALMASVYVRRDGRWRLALHQQTPEP